MYTTAQIGDWLQAMAYLTNTVYVQSLDDIEAMDLHARYTELLKAYEAVIQGESLLNCYPDYGLGEAVF